MEYEFQVANITCKSSSTYYQFVFLYSIFQNAYIFTLDVHTTWNVKIHSYKLQEYFSISIFELESIPSIEIFS